LLYSQFNACQQTEIAYSLSNRANIKMPQLYSSTLPLKACFRFCLSGLFLCEYKLGLHRVCRVLKSLQRTLGFAKVGCLPCQRGKAADIDGLTVATLSSRVVCSVMYF